MQVSPGNLINRRKFVKLSVSGAVGAGLATIPLSRKYRMLCR